MFYCGKFENAPCSKEYLLAKKPKCYDSYISSLSADQKPEFEEGTCVTTMLDVKERQEAGESVGWADLQQICD